MIPKTISQTGPYQSIDTEYLNKINQYAKGYEYKYFNDEDCLKFFEENPIEDYPEVSKIFNTLTIDGANRSQLFRYYYLFLKGGVYLDTDALFLVDLDRLIEGYTYSGVKNCTFRINNRVSFDGFIACKPKHPIMSHMLKFAYEQMLGKKKIPYFFACREIYKQYSMYTDDNNCLFLYEDRICEGCQPLRHGHLVKDKNQSILFHFPGFKNFAGFLEQFSKHEK